MPTAPKPPKVYAARRTWSGSGVDLSRYNHLLKAWSRTEAEMKRITDGIKKIALPQEVRTLAVAGSLGRMEFTEKSDCDLMVILDDAVLKGDYSDEGARRTAEVEAQKIYEKVWELLKPLSLEPPKATGTFSSPTSEAQLCGKKNVGNSQEDMKVLAKRQLLLLETQPVYKPNECDKLTTALLDSYAEGYVKSEPHKEWGFLINDLVRYFRSICVNYQWDFNNEHGKWPIRNTKLRHSRLIMFSGLLFLLGECSRAEKKIDWMRERLKMTPLERIAHVYESVNDTNFFRIAGLYNTFLGYLSDQKVRDYFKQADEHSYEKRYEMDYYPQLKANSDGLVAELLRFVFNCRGVWTERFFEYLIF
jgi:hypothetical protein